MKLSKLTAIATPLFYLTTFVHGQTCNDLVKAKVVAYQTNPTKLNENGVTSALRFDQGATCLVEGILSGANRTTKLVAEAKAAFQQNGPSSGAGGSTNLLSKGTTAKVLSLAAEYGGLTETTSGQTVTLQGSLAGIPTLLAGKDILPYCTVVLAKGSACTSNKLLTKLDLLSYSVAFNTGQGTQAVNGTPASSTTSSSASQQVVFTASGQTISSVTAKAVLIRGASATAADIATAVGKLAATDTTTIRAIAIAGALTTLTKDFDDDSPALTNWRASAFARLTSAAPDQIEPIWEGLGASLVATLSAAPYSRDTLIKDCVNYANSFSNFGLATQQFFESLRKAPVLSAEYDYNSPASQPSNSTIRLIYGQSVGLGWTLTFNGAGSFYNSTPSSTIPNSGRLRDVQIAAEGAYNFGKARAKFLGNSTASVAYYFQDQTSPAILNVTPGQPATGVTFTGLPSNVTQVYAQKGVINIAQGKFTFIPGNSSINLPISVTWSNRTELVTQSVWRGQVGVSYDFDSLFPGK